MDILDEIKAPIKEEMKEFEKYFDASMKSSSPLLDKITNYIIRRKGKQMRPMFVFLSAKTCGEITRTTYTAAVLIELLHTATLIHDDVVDNSHLRRGFFSINALWKNKIAVLVGDYLLSKGLLISLKNNDYQLLHIVSDAVRLMSEGELLQIQKARSLNITEDIYFEIIRRKTASLFFACCACGAASVSQSANDAIINNMHKFGENVGIAFQLKDDLLDYGNDGKIGKPTGIDIREQKFTLPLIYALNNAPYADKRRIINIIKNHNHQSGKVKEAINFVINSGGIEYANSKMVDYHKKALDILKSFPDNPARKSLEQLVNFTINRKR